MSDILSQLWTPELQMAVTVCIVMLVAVYVLSIIWVVRDAYQRGTVWYIWAIVALIPILGIIAYCLLRPPLLQIDRDEQELEVALKQRQLMQYGECANCATPLPGVGARRSGRTTGAPRQAVPQANVGAHGQAPRQ